MSYALVLKRYDVFKLLINNKASLTKGRGTTPLLLACKSSDVTTLKLILEQKVDKEVRDRGFTPLWIATMEGNIDCIKTLIEADADANAPLEDHQSPFYGMTPLMYACSKGIVGAVEILSQTANVNIRNRRDNATAMHLVCFSGTTK